MADSCQAGVVTTPHRFESGGSEPINSELPQFGRGRSTSLVIFTDLDGTLLDHHTYSFEAARDALARIRTWGAPLVLCSSKTRREIEVLRRQLGNRDPFISENGSAVFIPSAYFPFGISGSRSRERYRVIEFGRSYRDVVALLRETAARLGVSVVGFGDMSVREVATACGLSMTAARLARHREYDEPFRVVTRAPAARARLARALRNAGLCCVRGGRFDHATGCADKGTSVAALTDLYRRVHRRVLTVGLGDSLNDLTLLQQVDIPVIVRNPAAGATARLRRKVPHAIVTGKRGPAGWAEAVTAILTEVGDA